MFPFDVIITPLLLSEYEMFMVKQSLLNIYVIYQLKAGAFFLESKPKTWALIQPNS